MCPMADYYRLISRAVAELGSNGEPERREFYERARAALLSRLQALDPPLDDIRRTKERLALEETFRRVEARIEAAAERGLSFAEFDHHASIVAALGGLAGALHQQSQGARMEMTSAGVLRFAVAPSAADRDIATTPINERNQADLRARCAELDDTLRRATWRPRLAGLLRAVEILAGLLKLPVAQTADRIGTVWSLVISLRAYVEQNEDARREAGRLDEALDDEVLHAVREFVFAVGPWVRRFPSGRNLDNDVGTWVDADGDFEEAAALLQRVERLGLFGGEDAMILAITLDAGKGGSVPAIRARCFANATIHNIGIILVQALVDFAKTRIGADGATFAVDAEAAQALEIVVIDVRDELASLLSPLVPGLDADAVHAAFQDLAPLPLPG
jgi:hypothetical protein